MAGLFRGLEKLDCSVDFGLRSAALFAVSFLAGLLTSLGHIRGILDLIVTGFEECVRGIPWNTFDRLSGLTATRTDDAIEPR